MRDVTVPDPALVVLVGPSGSGKSTWVAAGYRQAEVVCSDQLGGIVGSGEHDLDASADAFALLDQILAARLRRRLNTVVDTLGLDAQRRRAHLEPARRAGLPAVAVLFGTDAAECRRRNRGRARPVPADVLDSQLRRMPDVAAEIPAEGWAVISHADGAASEPSHTAGSHAAAGDQCSQPAQLSIVLQISRFPWGDDPAAWLAAVANAAAEAGLGGIALMDHLIQIPQVGRAWEPIPEPWVTLGMLAGLAPGLRLGTLVSPVTFRPPGVLAKPMATLDVLTGGGAFSGRRAGGGAGPPAGRWSPCAGSAGSAKAAIVSLPWSSGSEAGPRPPRTLTCIPRARPRVASAGTGSSRSSPLARSSSPCAIPAHD